MICTNYRAFSFLPSSGEPPAAYHHLRTLMASRKTIRTLQVLFLILIFAAAIRVIVILRERSARTSPAAKAASAPPLNREAYVVPKRLHISSLQSAKQLTEQPVWAKEGYRYTVYPYANHIADFKHPAGMLLPIQKIQPKDVTTAAVPGYAYKQVLAIFDQDSKSYAVPIGMQGKEDLTIY